MPPQTNSRRTQNAYNVDEELDEDTHSSSVEANDEADDVEHDASQGASTAFQQVIVQGLHDQEKIYNANKKRVKKNYNTTKAELHDEINKMYDEHEDRAETAHRAQLTRLAELLALKASLESQMAAKLTSLSASYNAHSRELSSVVDSRIKELK